MNNSDDMNGEERIVAETGLDARIASIVSPVLHDEGFRLVRVRLLDQNGLTLQIMAERPDGTMTVEDCQTVSDAVSPVLDIEDPVSQPYSLEVSSPGIDRPLVRKSDFETWAGHDVKIETEYLVENRKRFRGLIVGLEDDFVVINSTKSADESNPKVRVPLDSIATARLTLTDTLINDALKRDKALRKAQARERE